MRRLVSRDTLWTAAWAADRASERARAVGSGLCRRRRCGGGVGCRYRIVGRCSRPVPVLFQSCLHRRCSPRPVSSLCLCWRQHSARRRAGRRVRRPGSHRRPQRHPSAAPSRLPPSRHRSTARPLSAASNERPRRPHVAGHVGAASLLDPPGRQRFRAPVPLVFPRFPCFSI